MRYEARINYELLGFLSLRNAQTIEPTTAWTTVSSSGGSTRYSFLHLAPAKILRETVNTLRALCPRFVFVSCTARGVSPTERKSIVIVVACCTDYWSSYRPNGVFTFRHRDTFQHTNRPAIGQPVICFAFSIIAVRTWRGRSRYSPCGGHPATRTWRALVYALEHFYDRRSKAGPLKAYFLST